MEVNKLIEMIFKFFILIVVISSKHCFGQVALEDDDEARLYMATFTKRNTSNVWISCTGTFIKENYVLTAATCVIDDIDDPRNLHIRSGPTNVWLVQPETVHTATDVIIHPKFNDTRPLEYNIAVVKLAEVVSLPENLKPRGTGQITASRYCTMLGWEGYDSTQSSAFPLQMFPVPIAKCDDSKVYCTTKVGVSSSFAKCGGLMGAPIFCNGDSISGIVVQDKFCDGEIPVGGRFISLVDFKDWIKEATTPPPPVITTPAGATKEHFSKFLIATCAWIVIKSFI